MDEVHRYLFDLRGYLIIPDVLSAAEVAELNRLIDAQNLPGPGEDEKPYFNARQSLFDA